MQSVETFDCFLSHNSRDKPAVRALAAELRARGLTVWLDEEQLQPGLPWQPLLESGIRASKSAAVLVGADGLGPWEQEEMSAALTLAKKDGRPVIPVLLPDAPNEPELPLFLGGRTWVDLRQGTAPGAASGLDLLDWGITGRRPDGPPPPQDSRSAPTAPATHVRPARWSSVTRTALTGVLSIAFAGVGVLHLRSDAPAPPAQIERRTPRAFTDPMTIGGEGPEMVAIPAGCFLMGSPPDEPERTLAEGPQHRVCLDAFSMGRTEVTFDQYDRFAEATDRKKPSDRDRGRGNRPVINVSWKDAADYADWLSGQTGQRYRLPTEAEWEYAARAGTATPFWTGGCIHSDQAKYGGSEDYADCGATAALSLERIVAAGSLPPNPWGLHEVAGNVYEWTQDCWHASYLGAPANGSPWLDPEGGDCASRVVRGGSGVSDPGVLRSAFREGAPADEAFAILGFRLARTP
jgi:formylglycine-generating enzyme required for sulfatase activity